MKFKTTSLATAILSIGLLAGSLTANAEDYKIDKEGMHASIQFRVQHLGYSWLYGRFNDFGGTFSFDAAAPEKSSVEVTINTNSVDSNHAERDKHLRSVDFLDVEKFPEAKFVSTNYTQNKDGKGGILKGEFTLHGVTKPLEITVDAIGAGDDPWGGYRRGFEGKTKFAMADFGIIKDLGPKSKDVELTLSIEGIRTSDQK